MKKKLILSFILGGIIFSGITAYAAYKYQAGDVGYTPKDSKFKVDNVDNAINELYDKTNNCKEYYSKATYVAPKTGETHKGIVYLDPTDLQKKCTEKEAASNVNKNGIPTEIKTGCMKWYVFDDSGDNYTMILDHNTTAGQQWYSSNTNVAYENSLVKPVVDKLLSESEWKVTPRLITVEEINMITEKTSFNVSATGSWYFFDDKTQSQTANANNKSKYAWLFDYTYNCLEYGCNIADDSNHGYWTQTPVGTSGYIWTVYCRGRLGYTNDDSVGAYGVRPVITISKSIIK